jgi:hypothetical protein
MAAGSPMMYTVVPPIEGRKICAGGGKRSPGGPCTKNKKGGPSACDHMIARARPPHGIQNTKMGARHE